MGPEYEVKYLLDANTEENSDVAPVKFGAYDDATAAEKVGKVFLAAVRSCSHLQIRETASAMQRNIPSFLILPDPPPAPLPFFRLLLVFHCLLPEMEDALFFLLLAFFFFLSSPTLSLSLSLHRLSFSESYNYRNTPCC